MAEMNFQTQNEPFRALIGNGFTYTVPRFQRDYSWGETEWDDLWADIVDTVRDGGEPAHYMGYLVLQSTGEQERAVIDGQQRLTTLSLIVLAGLRNLKRLIAAGIDPTDNQLRLDQIRNTYIGYLNPVTLTMTPKLTLNRHNNGYYQDYIVPLHEVLPQRGFNASALELRKAFEWFDKRLTEYVSGAEDKGAAIASFIDRMSIRLFFTVILVTDELNAYRVFETLNARGVQLSSTDLLKNYLFSVLSRDNVGERELERLDERWANIVDRLGSERFPAYLRVHWNSRHRDRVRESELFKVVRSSVQSSAAVFQLMTDLETDLDTYLLLTERDTQGVPAEIQTAVHELALFRVRQPQSLLLASHRLLPPRDFLAVLKACVVVSFRYNVIGNGATGDQETVYSNIVRRLVDGEITTGNAVIQALTPVYRSDEQFRTEFAERVIRTGQGGQRRLVRYILSRLERHLSGNDYPMDSAQYSIEHILPENPGDGWQEFDDRAVEQNVYRLGNMTLLESNTNRNIGSEPYEIKRPHLAESTIDMTRHIANTYEEWTPQTIAQCQQWMARQAVGTWRVPHL